MEEGAKREGREPEDESTAILYPAGCSVCLSGTVASVVGEGGKDRGGV